MKYCTKMNTGHLSKVITALAMIALLFFTSLPLLADDDIEVEGPIEAIGQDSLVVSGFVFFVDGNTTIKGPHGTMLTFSDLQVGDYVEVKGVLQANGTYLATKIEVEDQETEIKVKGFIQEIGQDSLVVNNTVIFVDSNTVVKGPHGTMLTFSDLQVGDYVKVKAVMQANGAYLAIKIEVKDEGSEFETEGFIEAIGMDSLVVNGMVFYVDSNTVVKGEHGMMITFADLQVGDYVEVKATLQPNGTYLASKIELENEHQNEIKVTAPIDTLYNDTLVVAGIAFWTDANTEIYGHGHQPLTFSDLEVGMIVKVKGFVQPNGSNYAAKIKVEDFWHPEIEVEGYIDSLGMDWLALAGNVFFVDSTTIIRGHQNNPLSFSDLMVGMKVEVHAIYQPDSTLLATRIKVEDDNNTELEVHGPIDSLGTSSVFVAGIDFEVNSATLILNHANDPISFSDLTVGLFVEVKAFLQPNGTYLATKIKIEDNPNFSSITGPIMVITPSAIVVGQPQYQVQTSTVVLNQSYQPVSYSDLTVGQQVTLWSDNSANGSPVALQIKINTSGNLTGLDNEGSTTGTIISKFELGQNYPNPFNPSTTIPLTVNSASWHKVQLTVYNTLGQKVRTLFNGLLNSGRYEFTWDGRNDFGVQVASGIYFYQIRADVQVVTSRRMLFVK